MEMPDSPCELHPTEMAGYCTKCEPNPGNAHNGEVIRAEIEGILNTSIKQYIHLPDQVDKEKATDQLIALIAKETARGRAEELRDLDNKYHTENHEKGLHGYLLDRIATIDTPAIPKGEEKK